MQNKIENKISFKKGRIILVFLILEYGEKYRWRTIEIELFRFDIYIYIYLETCEELLRVKVNYEDGRRVNQRGKGGLIRLRISKDNHISAIRSRSRGLVWILRFKWSFLEGFGSE